MTGKQMFHPSWPIFYEDNHLFVLYKPAGLLVQGDRTNEPSLLEFGKAWLKEQYHKPGRVFLGLVHRLDRPVAGVIVFGRTSKAAGRLSEQFRSGKIRKTYLAILEGHLTQPSGRLIDLIEKQNDRSSRIVQCSTATSREGRLSYRLIDTARSRSLVEIYLETGRRHQIRVQFSHIGLPLVGDLRYGASAPLPQGQIALFARKITVEHPTRRIALEFQCPMPQGWPWPNSETDLCSPVWNWADLASLVSPTIPFNA